MIEGRPGDVLIELEGISKSYGSAPNLLTVLRDVNFRIHRGEYVAIIGPSGSGKSTLLNLLGCLDRPSTGRYLFEGEDIARFDDTRLSRLRNRRIGFVFQSFQLVQHLSVIENVELPLFYSRVPRGKRRARCDEMISKVGLGHRRHHVPSQLSGGENQRTAIARALSVDPAILLADEPTGNLDSNTSKEIMKLFIELWKAGRTIILITHDPEIAKAAPRRIAIRDGLIESDTVNEAVIEAAAT